MFTSYQIDFRSVSQNYKYVVNTFSATFMLSISLKALNIILMCFDGKCNHQKKVQEKVQQ